MNKLRIPWKKRQWKQLTCLGLKFLEVAGGSGEEVESLYFLSSLEKICFSLSTTGVLGEGNAFFDFPLPKGWLFCFPFRPWQWFMIDKSLSNAFTVREPSTIFLLNNLANFDEYEDFWSPFFLPLESPTEKQFSRLYMHRFIETMQYYQFASDWISPSSLWSESCIVSSHLKSTCEENIIRKLYCHVLRPMVNIRTPYEECYNLLYYSLWLVWYANW